MYKLLYLPTGEYIRTREGNVVCMGIRANILNMMIRFVERKFVIPYVEYNKITLPCMIEEFEIIEIKEDAQKIKVS